MSRHAFDVYERGFDEETGKTIGAETCPVCAGEVRNDGGQIDCRRWDGHERVRPNGAGTPPSAGR